MEGLSFKERLALLPKLDTEERTALHAQGQKAYAKHYASEGRTYISSWRDECHSDDVPGKEKGRMDNKLVDVDLGTPVLRPRVKNLAKSVIPVGCGKEDEKKRTKFIAETVITVESSDSDKKIHEKRMLTKSKKREKAEGKVHKSKEKLVQSKKKRVNDSSSNSSSRVEREWYLCRLRISPSTLHIGLKERRDRKRTKRAVLNPPTSNKENDRDDSCQTRKKSKVPAGFALMHGFTATNVGKERLTVKPPVSIGVFNKGKASARTKSAKRKTPHKKDGYFSESKFLSNFKRGIAPSRKSCTEESGSCGSEAGKSPEEGRRTAKIKIPSCDTSEIESIALMLNPPKQSKAPSVVWDIELGKSLCNNDHSVSVSSVKQGSITLDISHRTWAKQLCNVEQKTLCSPTLNPLPGIVSGGGSDGGKVSSSIAPSQSASQRMTTTHSTKLAPEKENHSKYFQIRDPSPTQEVQAKVDSEPPPFIHSNECHGEMNDVAMTEGQAENVLSLENDVTSNASHGPASGFVQKELGDVEHILAHLHALEPRYYYDFNAGVGHTDHLSYESYDVLETPETFAEQQGLGCEEETLSPYGCNDGLFAGENGEVARQQAVEVYAPVPGEFELCGYLIEDDPQYDYPDGADGQEDLEMEDFCGHSQGRDGSENCKSDFDGGSIIMNHDQSIESTSKVEAESIPRTNDELDTPQTHRFSQGRALLLGCSIQEDGNRRRNNHPMLSPAEVDVVKRLRDHWLPQKL
ncbi:hypothetical protein AX15_004509 [Amanita polypyramis BW_CC]|nr:hypothetical protein AX15_004509 [Amanita polypyramis BW_CC]